MAIYVRLFLKIEIRLFWSWVPGDREFVESEDWLLADHVCCSLLLCSCCDLFKEGESSRMSECCLQRATHREERAGRSRGASPRSRASPLDAEISRIRYIQEAGRLLLVNQGLLYVLTLDLSIDGARAPP